MAKSNSDDAGFDEKRRVRESANDDERAERRPRRQRSGESALARIIPYRNAMALTAYYCGFGGLITILGSIALLKAEIPQPRSRLVFILMFAGGGFLAVLANLFGILGLRNVTGNPEAKGTGHAVTGLIMGVLEILGLLALLVIGLQGTINWLSLRNG